ncbi:MAG: alpha/beta fold hydrolase [Planctomycetota bacterium]|nr:alpha/beta fold hydrolase [Planctomycetota bacterium]
MIVDLVQTRTSDGVRLDGVLQAAAVDSVGIECEFDAVALFSGVGSNFYGSALIESLADMFQQRGIAALRVNTRGHDGVCTVSGDDGGRLQGAAYEIVDDCRFDVEAWVCFLVERGYRRIALLGHSLGAVKVLHAQAHQPHAAVTRVIAVSPPSLAHERFVRGLSAGDFHSSMNEAKRLAALGHPEMLFQATFPFPLILSAGTYLDKYGSESRYDFLKVSRSHRCSILFTFGELELRSGGVAFENLPVDIEAAKWEMRPSVLTIPGANHFYAECFDVLNLMIRRNLGLD